MPKKESATPPAKAAGSSPWAVGGWAVASQHGATVAPWWVVVKKEDKQVCGSSAPLHHAAQQQLFLHDIIRDINIENDDNCRHLYVELLPAGVRGTTCP